MEVIFTLLIKLLGTAGFGTLFGGIMGIFNKKTDIKYKQLEYQDRERQREHELKQRALDAELMKQEWEGRFKVAEVEGESTKEAAAFSAMAESYKFAVPAKNSWMETFSSFIRPFISLAYFVVSSIGAYWIIYHAFHIAKIEFTTTEWYNLVNFVIEWVAFMSGTTIGWWFAMRAGKNPTLNRY